ncbi:response regulator [Helicobacter saguini]|uniref:Phosphate regulon transcriptional regulatory protein PhoB n=1 Tax=Helicobacter saguini TaxID=1548018 RepID=A0A099BA32_9HELI|nr:response regulator transcription factor [Helicobacter saguini]MWV63189.1 response regulator [Helicobacter saguini]MWV66141.1 response regulator [Helicobacter saguini]MWV68491.1 response regulator [Helicobacter saguini]MWV71955.1 response regulator [Helicobacter saguini]TLD95963.1 response regulator transcription factor [Helicobacter saguini]
MIFVVDDENDLRELIQYTLSTKDLASKGFDNPLEMLNELNKLDSKDLPKLILLDVGLPQISGIDTLKKLKQKSHTRDIPVIMLTAKNSEIDKVNGLDGGADDYITKPFGVLELLARVNAVLRRNNALAADEYSFKEVVLNPKTHTVSVANEPVSLTFKEFELLELFLSKPNLVFTREQLLDSIWGSEFQTRTVDVHINTLRTKLGDTGKYIKTIRGVGYKVAE